MVKLRGRAFAIRLGPQEAPKELCPFTMWGHSRETTRTLLLWRKGSHKPLLSTKSAFDLGLARRFHYIFITAAQMDWDRCLPAPGLTELNAIAQTEMLVQPLQSACSLWEAGSLVTRTREQPVVGRGDSRHRSRQDSRELQIHTVLNHKTNIPSHNTQSWPTEAQDQRCMDTATFSHSALRMSVTQHQVTHSQA
jgi:hypothetical protein